MSLTGCNLHGLMGIQQLPWRHVLAVEHQDNLTSEHLRGLYWSLLQSQNQNDSQVRGSPENVGILTSRVTGCPANSNMFNG